MKDLSSIPAPTRADHQNKIANIFRLIHERSAKTLFGLTGAAVVLPMVAEAQVSPATIDIDQVASIRDYELQEDGSIRATLSNGQKVLITQANVVIGADGALLITELAAEELLLASDSAYGMIGVSTGQGLAAAAGGVLGLAGLGGSSSNLISKVLKIIDAPLENALVFYDANADGEANQTEYLGLSDETGSINISYDPVAGGSFIIIPTSAIPATAGTDYDWDQDFIDQFDGIETRDTSTENVFTQILTASDAGSDVDQIVSPISTLVQKFVETGAAADNDAAEAAVKELLDIDDAVDLDTFDFAASLESDDATEVANAKDVLHKATAIANVVETALAVAEAQGQDDGAGGTDALDGEAVVSAADQILTSVVQTMAAIKESVDSADAGTLATVPTFDELIQAATAVAVADTLGGEEGEDDDVDAAALATALVDELEAGDDIDTAASDAVTAAGVEEVATVSALVNEVETASVGVKTQVDAATSLEDLDNDEALDGAEDALNSNVNTIINEQLLGIDLQADAKSGVENQVNFVKGNLLANDKYTNDLSLDSETELYSVNKKLIPEFLDTTEDQGTFILSTSDWNTPERTASAARLNDELDSDSNPGDIMAAFPTARQTGGSATAGSMIYTTITVTEDDVAGGAATLSFDYNFGSYDYLPYNDYSFFAVHAEEGGTAAEQTGRILRGVSDGAGGTADVRDLKGTGLYTEAGTFLTLDGSNSVSVGTNSSSYTYEFTTAGTYKVGIGITDVRDKIVDSVMSVSNIQYTPNGGIADPMTDSDFQQIGNVQVDGGMVESVNVALIQGTFGNLIVTKGGDYLYEVTPANSANIEDIPAGETVTEDFSYTVKTLVNGVEQFATSKLTVTITGTEFDPTITITEDAILGVDADDVNSDTEAGYSVSGEIENVPDGATVTVTISDGTNPDVVVNDITIETDDNGDGTYQVEGIDVSGLDDGDLTVTAAVSPDGSGDDDNQSVTVLKDTDADVGDDFSISYGAPSGGTIEVTVSGLDADATAVINFSAGDSTGTQGVEADGTFSIDVSDLDGSQAITATVDIIDDVGNEIIGQQLATFFAPEFSASIDGDVTSANAANTTITLTSEAIGAEVTALSVTDGTNTVNLSSLLGDVTIGAGGSVEVTGANLSSLADGDLTINATITAEIAGNDETVTTTGSASKDTDADADATPASVAIAFASEEVDETVVNLTLSGLDSDVTATDVTVTFTDGTTTVGPVAFTSDGTLTVDLADMAADTAISSTVLVTDDAGNTHSFNGKIVSFGTVPTISVDAGDVINDASDEEVTITGSTTNATDGGTVIVTVTDSSVGEVVLDTAVDVQSDGSFSAVLNLSSLLDGDLTVVASVTTDGDPVDSAPVTFEKDTDADVGDDVNVTLSDDLGDIFDTEVTATITGLDADASAEITFQDESGNSVSGSFVGGTIKLNLADLTAGDAITSSVVVTDDAGNTATVAGPSTAFNTAAIYNATQDIGYTADQLQLALDSANSGDTIQLAAGDITGDATISTSVNIVGAHAGEAGANAIDPSNMDIEGRGGESNLTGTITVATSDVSIDGVKLDADTPIVWDLENAVGGNGLDNFTLQNSVMTTYGADGVPTLGPIDGTNPASYAGDPLVQGWTISGNLIGGVTSGNAGTMYLAGLDDSDISGNVFVRPTAGHLYLSSLTDTTINDNFFYHGVHAGGVDLDGNGEYFNGIDGYGYGYGYGNNDSADQAAIDAFLGRNFWLELKGENSGVTIDGNDGQYNSGGVQLYGEFGNEVFNDITISNNTFRDFVNADPGGALEEGGSGFLGAIAISVADENASASDITITGNDITLAQDQVFDTSDLNSLIYVNGKVTDGADDGSASVQIDGNTVSIVETSSAAILAAQDGTSSFNDTMSAIFVGEGIEDNLQITNNDISEAVSLENIAGVYVAAETFMSEGADLNFHDGMTGDVDITGNTFSGFAGASLNDVVFEGLDLTSQYEDASVDANATMNIPYVVLDDSPAGFTLQSLPLELVFGTSADETINDEAGDHAIMTAGGSDTVNLNAGIDYVALDGMESDGDIVTITNFSTAEVDETFSVTNAGDVDGIALYNLNTDDLRSNGGEGLQLTTGSETANADAGLLVFTNELDFTGGAAAAIEAAVQTMTGIGNGETLFAVGMDSNDTAALVRVEVDGAGAYTTTQIADIQMEAGANFDGLAFAPNGFIANFSVPEAG